MIYISHRLDEVFKVCDRATVLRDGRKIGTVDIIGNNISKDDSIKMMVGRELGQIFSERKNSVGKEIVMSIRNFTKKGEFQDINFDLKRGEF